MNQYELVLLYHPDIEIDLDKAIKKINSAVKDAGGRVLASDNWGKRKLAYQIVDQDYAIYVYDEIELPPDQIPKLETALNLADEVIRYLLTKPTPNFGVYGKKDAPKEDDVAPSVPAEAVKETKTAKVAKKPTTKPKATTVKKVTAVKTKAKASVKKVKGKE